MAIARCQQCGNPKDTKQEYPHPHSPQAEPRTRIMCGSRTCNRPAMVWLSDAEEQRYQRSNERIFTVIHYRGVVIQ